MLTVERALYEFDRMTTAVFGSAGFETPEVFYTRWVHGTELFCDPCVIFKAFGEDWWDRDTFTEVFVVAQALNRLEFLRRNPPPIMRRVLLNWECAAHESNLLEKSLIIN